MQQQDADRRVAEAERRAEAAERTAQDAVREREVAEREREAAERTAQDAERELEIMKQQRGTGNLQVVCGFPVALCMNEHTILSYFQTLNKLSWFQLFSA